MYVCVKPQQKERKPRSAVVNDRFVLNVTNITQINCKVPKKCVQKKCVQKKFVQRHKCAQAQRKKKRVQRCIGRARNHDIQSSVFMYVTISDGDKRIYTNDDGVQKYNRIYSARHVSIINVFINGMLQPPTNYSIHRGRFRLRTRDLPEKGVPIIIQFIRFGEMKKGGDCMPASLIKLYVSATASAPTATGGTVTTTVDPGVTRYSASVTSGMIGTDTTIPAASFVDDSGTAVTDLPAPPTDGYFNVYVNGVLQQGGLSTLSTTNLVISTTAITAGTPVVLEVADFSNTTSDIATEPTISAPDITVTV